MTQPPPPPPYTYAPPPPLSPADQRLWATLIHAGGIFFGILPSLIGYLVAKDRGAFIREHTRIALNFHLTVIIAVFACGILSIILIGVFLLIALEILIVVFSILAAVAANNGQYYRFPISITFIK
ncbi:MAG TPA: DUF4870 domain-containing protein [Galbitalea sp.]|nr:DUF4870 domain-containing protein [Galbitalea sp.]